MSSVRLERSGTPLDVWWLDNGTLRLGFVPALGGRLLAVRLHGRELLWRNPELLSEELQPVGHVPKPVTGSLGDWVNYGGEKTWPAPQGWDGPGQWAGPPDPVLDSGPYAVSTELGAIEMTSGDDPRTGLRLTRRYALYPRRPAYLVVLTARNVSDRPVRWALWNVTQFRADDPDGGVRVGSGPEVLDLVSGTGNPRHSAADGVVHVPHQEVVGKVGFPAATGWLAHTDSGLTLRQSFEVDPGATYPDGGSRVEVWLECPQPAPLAHLGDLDPPARIMECEVLGPLATLAPGEERSLTLDCTVTTDTGEQT